MPSGGNDMNVSKPTMFMKSETVPLLVLTAWCGTSTQNARKMNLKPLPGFSK